MHRLNANTALCQIQNLEHCRYEHQSADQRLEFLAARSNIFFSTAPVLLFDCFILREVDLLKVF